MDTYKKKKLSSRKNFTPRCDPPEIKKKVKDIDIWLFY